MLKDAADFALRVDYTKLDWQDLITINGILEPQIGGSIRNTRVRVTNSQVPRPNPVKLVELLEETFTFANILDSELDRALFLHLRLAYLHPFPDGNDRTIRVYTNALLNSQCYPSIIIPEGEREFYFQLLENGMVAHLGRLNSGDFNQGVNMSEPEKMFYSYLGSKVNVGLDDALSHIEQNTRYLVHLRFEGNNDTGFYVLTRQIVDSYARKRGLGLTSGIRDSGGGHKVLEVTGGISLEDLEGVLGSVPAIKTYDIEVEK